MASSSHATLDAAATERKARLAKLASLKRKQPEPDEPVGHVLSEAQPSSVSSKTDAYLSGRNYDPETRAPRLGFDAAPPLASATPTLESQATSIAQQTTVEAAETERQIEEKGIDLFKLQPKKPNWDLKRDLAEKMKVLDVRTQNAIARLVRERIEKSKKEALEKQQGQNHNAEDEGEEIGIGGNELVESVHLRESEERNAEPKEALSDGEEETP